MLTGGFPFTCQEIPFEDVIFEEAGFLPADVQYQIRIVMTSASDIMRFLFRFGVSVVGRKCIFCHLTLKFFAEIICNTKNFSNFTFGNHDTVFIY